MYSKSSAMARLLSSRNGHGLGGHELHFVPSPDQASSNDSRVECELASKPFHDPSQDTTILLERVRIECSHDTASAQTVELDDHIAHMQAATGPRSLRKALDTGDNKIGAQPPAVVAKGRDRPIGRDEQGQDVESIGTLVAHQPRTRADDPLDVRQNVGRCPRTTIHQRLPRNVQTCPVPEQARMGSRGHDPTLNILDVDDAVTLDAERSDNGPLERLASHRLHRVTPELRDVHPGILRSTLGFVSATRDPSVRAVLGLVRLGSLSCDASWLPPVPRDRRGLLSRKSRPGWTHRPSSFPVPLLLWMRSSRVRVRIATIDVACVLSRATPASACRRSSMITRPCLQ